MWMFVGIAVIIAGYLPGTSGVGAGMSPDTVMLPALLATLLIGAVMLPGADIGADHGGGTNTVAADTAAPTQQSTDPMAQTPAPQKLTHNRQEKRRVILDAALDVFCENGLRGATLDMIGRKAGLSKQNIIYYFPTKEALYTDLLESQLDTWLEPLREMDAAGDPVEEILTYVRRKLALSETMQRESRLFATEILRNAPHLAPVLTDRLRMLVDQKAAIIAEWMREGRLAVMDPYHLIFSIWSMTQHYADFDVQVVAVLGADRAPHRFEEAETFVTTAMRRIINPPHLA